MDPKYQKLLKYIDPDQLPWDYRELVDIVGLEKTLEIAARVGGTYMYMEKLDTILMPAKRSYVDAQRKGDQAINVRQVARDLDISQEAVYIMLRPGRDKDKDSGWKQESLV